MALTASRDPRGMLTILPPLPASGVPASGVPASGPGPFQPGQGRGRRPAGQRRARLSHLSGRPAPQTVPRRSSPCRSPARRAVAVPRVDAFPVGVRAEGGPRREGSLRAQVLYVPGRTSLGGVPGSAKRWPPRRKERRLRLIAELQDWIGHCLRLLAWIGSFSGVPSPTRREGDALRVDGHFCVRATLRCHPAVIEPEVIEIGPGQANGSV